MLITESNIDIWYRAYVAQRQRSEKYVKSRKGETRGLPVSTKAEFKLDFLSSIKDNPKLSGKQLAEKMAKEETYKLSQKQVTKIAEGISTYHGRPITPGLVAQVRVGATGADPFWSNVTARQLELREAGIPWEGDTGIQAIIGQEFFGSP